MDSTQIAINAAKAIRQIESGGDYSARSKDGSFGAYQFIKPTWDRTAPKYGVSTPWESASREEQNKVAVDQIKEWIDTGKAKNIGEIASMWNAGEGRPQAYIQGLKGTNKDGVNYDVAGYAEKVANEYQKHKGSSPQQPGGMLQPPSAHAEGGLPPIPGYSAPKPPEALTMAPMDVADQRQALLDQGEAVSTNENRAEPTMAGKIIRGIIEPVATLLARPVQLAKALGGASEEEQTIKSSYLGDIKTSSSGKDVVKDIGRGLETVSLGIGGGGATTLAKGLGKQSALTLAKQGAKEGLKAGILGGAGASIEEGNPVVKVATDTLLGGGIGAVTGGVLGAGSGIVGKGANIAGRGLKATGLVNAGEKGVDDAVNRVAQEYERAAGTGLPNKFRQRQLTRSGDFKPWSNTLAEYGIVPKEGIDHTWDVGRALDDLDAINEEFGKAKGAIIKNEHALFNVDEAIQSAEQSIDQYIPSERARDQAKAMLRDEIEAVLGKSGNIQLNAQNQRIIPIDQMERLRDIGYSFRKFDPSDTLKVKSSVGKAMSQAINQTVDKYATFPSYRAFNREWSNILNAQDALEQLSTKKVRLDRGLSGQIALKTLAPILGFSQGGIMGAILGDLGAQTAGRLLSDPELRTIISRSIIRKATQKLPKDKIIADIEREIAEYTAKQGSLLKLPAGKVDTTIPLGPYTSPDANQVQVIQGKNAPLSEDAYIPQDKLPVIEAGNVPKKKKGLLPEIKY